MDVNDLTNKVDELKDAIALIEEKRETWQNTTKPLLIDVLSKIRDAYDFQWYIQVLDWTKKLEGVNLTFGDSSSGIVEETDESLKSYVKYGGTIVFSQAYNGDIFVIIIYPYVEEFVGESGNKLLGKFHPNEITEAFIIEKVSVFLDELIRWEKASYGTHIGFK